MRRLSRHRPARLALLQQMSRNLLRWVSRQGCMPCRWRSRRRWVELRAAACPRAGSRNRLTARFHAAVHPMANVFISHTGADAEWAEQICQWLRDDTHNVFLDVDKRDGVSAGD